MHENEQLTDPELVSRLIGRQFPEWAGLEVTSVDSSGTDNALYRLGKGHVVRLPRIDWAVEDVHKEHTWLPRFAPALSIRIPTPIALGEPDCGYPWNWSVYEWLPGKNISFEDAVEPQEDARRLAQFVREMRELDTTDGVLATAPGMRGAHLLTRDERVRRCIAALTDEIDGTRAIEVWEHTLTADIWDGDPVWYHGDLLAGNLLFEDGRLHAVIDFGCSGMGDPACDLMVAWAFFQGESREVFRTTVQVDDAMWVRGRGQALAQAVTFLEYYLHTNPEGVQRARQLLKAVLADTP